MSGRPEDLMAGYLLGELFADERARIDELLATGAVASPDEAAALAAVHSVALYTIPTRPAPRIRDNLVASLTGRRRLLPFRDRVADFLAIDDELAETVLTTIDHRVGWTAGDEGSRARVVLSGHPGSDAQLLRAPPGAALPRPPAATSADLLVLQGALRDDDGTIAGPGARLHRPLGSRYRFETQQGDEVIVLIVTREHVAAI